MTVLQRYELLGDTPTLVAKLLAVCFPDARTALDLTPGRGNFWSEQVPIGVTVEFSPYDFTELPYPDGSRDVPLFDPPHIADGGEASIMRQRFGTYRYGDLEPTVRAGCREAWRVARLGVIVKVCDHVHAQRFQRMSGWAIDELGEPYEVVHAVRRHALEDPKWRQPQLSARSNGSTYLVFRHDGPLHRRRGKDGATLTDPTPRCDRRPDATRSPARAHVITPKGKAER